ncbi:MULTISPECIES: hypothetical protein [unclassified Frankia]|uniref:hypothetical protein n=1 Tax=unclassified Frankia TaxID=2632575 RepID=UPI002AD39B98|nr:MULTISPECIES: hypothetical protein [unclassified Frankia]
MAVFDSAVEIAHLHVRFREPGAVEGYLAGAVVVPAGHRVDQQGLGSLGLDEFHVGPGRPSR